MKILKRIAVAGVLALPFLAGAQEVQPVPASSNPLQQIFGILERLTNWLLTALLVLAGIFIIFAAYQYLTAAGNEEKVKSAKNIIIYAVVAIGIGLLAKVIDRKSTRLNSSHSQI